MSDEESLPIEVEDTTALSAANAGGEAEQAIRMPQSFEFAGAVIGEKQLPGWLVPVSNLLERFYLHTAGALVAVLVLSLLLGWLWVGVVAYMLATIVDYLASRQLQRDVLLLHRVGIQGHVRYLVRGALLVALFGRVGFGVAAAAWAGVMLTVVLVQVLNQSATAWLAARQPPLVYRPDGNHTESSLAFARVYRRSSWLPKWLITTDVIATALITVVAAVAAPAWAVIVLAAAVMAGLLAVEAALVLRVRQLGSDANTEKVLAEVNAQLDETAPEVLVYMAGGALAEYILNQWIPTIERLHQSSFVIIREAIHLRTVMVTHLPLIYAPSTRHVEALTRPTVRVAFYPANAGKNVHLLREARLKHVFLNHGDSDKSTSANPFVRVYDEVWVAGEAAVERYEAAGIHMPRSQYAIVGRPQVERLKVGPLAGFAPRTLLYAPTFEGYYEESNYSSLEYMGPQMIERILDAYPGVRIIFKPHPATGVQRPGMAKARLDIVRMLGERPGGHLYIPPGSELNLQQCFDMADLLLSDISSVVTDFLYTERPLVTTNPRRLPRDLFNRTFPTQRASYILDGSLDNFTELMDDALGPDSQREARLEVKRYVLGDHPEGPTATFVAQTDRLVRAAAEHAASIRNEFRLKS